jgi:hypothetical protein
MGLDPDDIFAKLVLYTLPLWGPFYALYYILRLMWYEFFQSRE